MGAAIILAGGRSSRLGGVDKLALIGPDGRTSLQRVVAACDGESPVVVVGAGVDESACRCPAVVVTCEEPPGSGPARAVAAGVRALGELPGSTLVYVLAGDMPGVGAGMAVLAGAWASTGGVGAADGVLALNDGRREWLLGLYRLEALRRACARLAPWQEGQAGESVRWLLGQLELAEVAVAAEAAADLDTWADVGQAGYRAT